nr:hypothetical protein GCM10025732_48860 [Glycomyces mayteni]
MPWSLVWSLNSAQYPATCAPAGPALMGGAPSETGEADVRECESCWYSTRIAMADTAPQIVGVCERQYVRGQAVCSISREVDRKALICRDNLSMQVADSIQEPPPCRFPIGRPDRLPVRCLLKAK